MSRKRKSGLIGALAALTGTAIVSIGFAAWVVSAADEIDMTGTISVETVESESFSLEVKRFDLTPAAATDKKNPTKTVWTAGTAGTDAATVKFGPLAEDDKERLAAEASTGSLYEKSIWLKHTETIAYEEAINFYYEAKITLKTGVATTTPSDVFKEMPTFTANKVGEAKVDRWAIAAQEAANNPTGEGADVTLKKTAAKSYVTAPTIKIDDANSDALVDLADTTKDSWAPSRTGDGEKDKRLRFVVSFGWGDAFENQNPYLYYNTKNSLTVNDTSSGTGAKSGLTYQVEAKTYLEELQAIMAGVTFKLTFTTNDFNAAL